MSWAKRFRWACTAVVAGLVLPNAASAHVGTEAPVATNFEALIRRVTPPSGAIEARVIDGDRELWLHTRGNATVLIPGVEGEPLLRFDPRGVFVNLRSVTAQSDRIDRFDLRPNPDPRARPLWHRLTAGQTYLWHEHRLHALEPLAQGHRRTAILGRWSVPLLIDGRPYALVGSLLYRPPGPAWPWILLPCGLAALLVVALAISSSAARHVAVMAALIAMLMVWALRIGRELYGRPGVGVTSYIEVALTSLVGIALLFGLLHRDQSVRTFTALAVGFGCLYQGLTMLRVPTHSVALTVLPTVVARAFVAVVLGLGAGVLAITLQEQWTGTTAEDGVEIEAETGKRSPPPLRKAGRWA